MWLENPKTGKLEPTHVNATANSVKKDYEILKENLPIQLGIDHLDDEILNQNKILQKMNLLNVGVIKDVKLENDKIKITDAEITNPIIRELHDKGELDDFSIVSDMYVSPCTTGQADQVEEYSVIKRVDFVGTGACKTCKVEPPAGMASNANRFNAKAIIGVEIMAADPNTGNQADPNADPKAGSDGNAEPTMKDVMGVLEKINTTLDAQNKAFAAIEGKLGIKEPAVQAPDPKADPAAAPAAASEGDDPKEGQANVADPAVVELQKDMASIKARAAKAEASGIVKAYLKEGKVKPAEVEKHVAMAMKAPEEYQGIMKDAPVIIDMEKHSGSGEGQASGASKIVDEEGNEIDLEVTAKEQDKMMGKGGE